MLVENVLGPSAYSNQHSNSTAGRSHDAAASTFAPGIFTSSFVIGLAIIGAAGIADSYVVFVRAFLFLAALSI